MKKIVCVLIIITLFTGCVSSTVMRVNTTESNGKPVDNAIVFVNGENIGHTPNASAKVSNFIGTKTEITVMKEGYHAARKIADGEYKTVNIILGILINVWALLWAEGPKEQQHVILIPETTE